MGEFDLIRRYFDRPLEAAARPFVQLGIGDDCALLQTPPGHELAVSTDMLVAGRHFLPDVTPAALGWKCLAVNLSDLAAVGADPRAFTLALALPQADPVWLDGFAHGLFECAAQHGCSLVGGDTTRGPLNVCITIFGTVPAGQALRRDGAHPDEDVWVSGQLGEAALGLRFRSQVPGLQPVDAEAVVHVFAALERPQPRMALGRALRGVASAALDVSDGLLGDLGHILSASGGLGATLDVTALPISDNLRVQTDAVRWSCALAGGDDYELCFTAAPARRAQVLAAAAAAGVTVTRIGQIDAAPGLRLVDGTGQSVPTVTAALGAQLGYDHFAYP